MGSGNGRGDGSEPGCCPLYHEAIELIGRRWTGAILQVLMAEGSMRFCEIGAAIPDLSDRLLSERMRELEARGVVERTVDPGPPVAVAYALTGMGRDLEPALGEIQVWAQRWLARSAADDPGVPAPHARRHGR